jgi:hypothetical protein
MHKHTRHNLFFFKCRVKLKHPVNANYETEKHQYFSIVSLPTDSVIVDHAVLCRPKNFGHHCLSIQKKKMCNPYFIVIIFTVLIMNVIFWVVNFKTQNYFVISTTQNVYLRLSMYYLLL